MTFPALLTLFTTAALLAQDPTPATPATPTTPAAPAAAPLPAAGSPAATELVDKALTKMLAYGRGTFATTEHQDRAMLRNVGLPFGDEDTEVTGGWQRGLLWGEHDGSEFLRANGRMLAKVGDTWKLRGKKLGSGVPVPFALDPELLFTVLTQLPADARKVAHVEAGEVAGKPVAILSLEVAGEAASELAESGALPGGGGGPGGFVMIGGPGGMAPPESDYTVYVALFVDPASGDLLRLSMKIFENNEQMGNVRIQVQGGPGGGDEEEAEDEEKADAKPATGDAAWKKGLPVRKPAKTESVTTYRVDFKKLGLAEAPQLDDKTKALLRL